MNGILFLLLVSTTAAFNVPFEARHTISIKPSQAGNGDANDSSIFTPRNDMRRQANFLAWDAPLDRRTILANAALAAAAISTSANAETEVISTLEKRINENSLSPPSYGMEASDIFYPSFFQGNWKASSKTLQIFAPCGFELFPGGESGYDNTVQKEIKGGDVLDYKARFVRGDDLVIADREYNAKEIAKAAMGSFSVVDVSQSTPNRFSCLLAPPEGSGGSLISVDILAIARKYESISPNKFSCSEVVRQIVSPANRSNPNAPPTSPLSVKEIETISVYSVENAADDSSVKEIKCKQRTATFLVPSQTDPMTFKMWQMSRGQPVDVRFYDVTYSKI